CSCSRHLRDLLSFPTRRSSDLVQGLGTNRVSQGDGDLVIVGGTTGYVKNVSSGKSSRTDGDRNALLGPDVRVLVVLTENCVTFRSEEHTSELQSRENLVCRLLL